VRSLVLGHPEVTSPNMGVGETAKEK